jgi:hypothetical protein
LPDGFFSNQKSQFEQFLEGLRLENVDIFYGHLEHFTDIWDILCMTTWYICVHLVHFIPVSVSSTKKNLATLLLTGARYKIL